MKYDIAGPRHVPFAKVAKIIRFSMPLVASIILFLASSAFAAERVYSDRDLGKYRYSTDQENYERTTKILGERDSVRNSASYESRDSGQGEAGFRGQEGAESGEGYVVGGGEGGVGVAGRSRHHNKHGHHNKKDHVESKHHNKGKETAKKEEPKKEHAKNEHVKKEHVKNEPAAAPKRDTKK